MIKDLPVIEIFGPVIQGEGLMAGRPTHFLRLGGCDYRCSWCDTMYAVDPAQIKENVIRMDYRDIRAKLTRLYKDKGCKTLTISGGNPCMHDLSDLCNGLVIDGWCLVLETQGTILPTWVRYMDVVQMSPKPPSSGMQTDWLRLDAFTKSIIGTKRCFKVVVFDEADYEYAKKVHLRYRQVPFYLQPGTNVQHDMDNVSVVRDEIAARTAWIMEKAMSDPDMIDCRVMPQLHAMIYGLRRGV